MNIIESPLHTVVVRGEAMLSHSDQSVVDRIVPYGYVSVSCRLTLVLRKDGSEVVSVELQKKSITRITPSLQYDGRSGKTPPPHMVYDKPQYVFGSLVGSDHERHMLYRDQLIEFYQECKAPCLKGLVNFVKNGLPGHGKLIRMIENAFGKKALTDEALAKLNVFITYTDGSPAWDNADVNLKAMWEKYLTKKLVDKLGTPRTNICTGLLEYPAKKITPVHFMSDSGILIPLQTDIDKINVNIGDRYASLAMNTLQDLLHNNSRDICDGVIVMAYSNMMDPEDVAADALVLDSIECYGKKITDEIDDLEAEAVVGAEKPDPQEMSINMEKSFVSPLLNAMDKFKLAFPVINKKHAAMKMTCVLVLHIPKKGQASIIGFEVSNDMHGNVLSYAEDTVGKLIYWGKAGGMQVIDRVPTVANINEAMSCHNKRTSKNKDVKRKSKKSQSYAQALSIISAITKKKALPVSILKQSAKLVLKDIKAYGLCKDILLQLSTLDAIFNNITKRNPMEKELLRKTSENFGRIMAIAAHVAKNKCVIGTDRPVLEAIPRIVLQPSKYMLTYVNQHLVRIYLTKFKRNYAGVAAQYSDEINSLVAGIERDDLDSPLDEASFAIGFHRKLVEITQEIQRRKEAKAKRNLELETEE